MRIELIGKTEGVFRVEINTDNVDTFLLKDSGTSTIRANVHYIDEIVEMLLKAKEILESQK